MVRALNFLQFQMLDYWRRAFSKRGSYDANSFFLVILILGLGYGYVLVLKNAAKSFSNGNQESLILLFGIVFFIWLIPVFESQNLSSNITKFLHLPITKTEFVCIKLLSVFLVPTSIIAIIVSLAAIYPFIFSNHIFFNVAQFLIFILLAIFSINLFVNLLKIQFFRVTFFLTIIGIGFLFAFAKTSFGQTSIIASNVITAINTSENTFLNVGILLVCTLAIFSLAFFSIRQTLLVSANSDRRIHPQFLSRLPLPTKFGQLLKRDFIFSWKLLDAHLSLFVIFFYTILLIMADFSFVSFSVALSISVMLSGSLAFNIFGLENSASLERLSLLPIAAKDLLITKNKTFALVVFSQLFILFPIVYLKFGAILLVISILKTLSIVLLYTAWGNRLSIKYPFKMNFYQISFGGSIPATLQGVLIISLAVILSEVLTAQDIGIKFAVNILLLIGSFFIYKFSFVRTAKQLPEHWETIKLNLS